VTISKRKHPDIKLERKYAREYIELFKDGKLELFRLRVRYDEDRYILILNSLIISPLTILIKSSITKEKKYSNAIENS
jgi:hypothetical protein